MQFILILNTNKRFCLCGKRLQKEFQFQTGKPLSTVIDLNIKISAKIVEYSKVTFRNYALCIRLKSFDYRHLLDSNVEIAVDDVLVGKAKRWMEIFCEFFGSMIQIGSIHTMCTIIAKITVESKKFANFKVNSKMWQKFQLKLNLMRIVRRYCINHFHKMNIHEQCVYYTTSIFICRYAW